MKLNLESNQPSNQKESTTNLEKLREIKEQVFHQLVQSKLIDTYHALVEQFDLPPETSDKITEYMAELKPYEFERLLSWPQELKLKIFAHHQNKIQADPTQVTEMLAKILEAAKKQISMIGYHASNTEIQPEATEDSRGKPVTTWSIKGTENDHRNDDLPMAYHSRDYAHLYLEKNPRYLYIVRTLPQKAKGDIGGAWGRDLSLSIIAKLNMHEIREDVEKMSRELLEQEKEPPESIRAAA